MEWRNYDRLVQHLNDLLVNAPERFNYHRPRFIGPEASGCVGCWCRELLGANASGLFALESIIEYLGVTHEEAYALWSPSGSFSPGLYPLGRYAGDRVGADGIREALRRLAILATRYERPAVAEPLPSLADRERRFLQSLQALSVSPNREVPHVAAD